MDFTVNSFYCYLFSCFIKKLHFWVAERKRPASIRDDYEGRIFVRSALVGYACNHCRLCRLSPPRKNRSQMVEDYLFGCNWTCLYYFRNLCFLFLLKYNFYYSTYLFRYIWMPGQLIYVWLLKEENIGNVLVLRNRKSKEVNYGKP